MPSLRFLAWWRFVGYVLVAAVIAGSLLPPSDLPQVHVSDKLEHILAYAVLMYWFIPLSSRRSFWVPGIALLALGIAIEFLQGASGYRDFEIADMVADAVGILLGLSVALTPAGRLLPAMDRWLAGRVGRG